MKRSTASARSVADHGYGEPSIACLLAGWRRTLGSVAVGCDSAALLDAAEELERLKRSLAAAQAGLAVQLLQVREAERLRDRALEDEALSGQPRSDVPPSRSTVRRGAIKEFSLASRLSPTRGAGMVNRAERLVAELPHTLAALTTGEISEWACELIDRQTRDLTPENAALVDEALVEFHATASDRELEVRAQQLAMSAEPETVLARAHKAPRERRVTLRPAGDGMTALTAVLPLRDGVAVKASLAAAARAARADGSDSRTDSQVEADELTERVTGHRAAFHQATPEQHEAPGNHDEPGNHGEPGYHRESEHQEGAGENSDHEDTAKEDAGREDTGREDTRVEESDVEDPRVEDSCVEDPRVEDSDVEEPAAGTTLSAAGEQRRDDTEPEGPEDPENPGLSTIPGESESDDTENVGALPEVSELRPGPGPAAACRHCGALDPPTTRPPIELGLIMTDLALFGHDHEPGASDAALLDGVPVPAGIARDLVTDPQTAVHVRRLYTHPSSGQLIAMESRRRLFSGVLRLFVATRDQRCRDAFCGAPIKDIDHVRPHSHGGATAAANGQGASRRCNQDKELPGFSSRIVADPVTGDLAVAPAITLRTPSGRTYTTRAPRLIASTSRGRADDAGA